MELKLSFNQIYHREDIQNIPNISFNEYVEVFYRYDTNILLNIKKLQYRIFDAKHYLSHSDLSFFYSSIDEHENSNKLHILNAASDLYMHNIVNYGYSSSSHLIFLNYRVFDIIPALVLDMITGTDNNLVRVGDSLFKDFMDKKILEEYVAPIKLNRPRIRDYDF